MDQVEEIKERLSIYDLVSEYVELKKAGRNFKGACPFHSEKTPSFVVSPEKGLAYCFGCNQGGDIFAFYQLIEGVDFVEALSNLADKVGVKIEAKVSSAELKHQKSQKQDIKELHDIAANFYHAQLLETDAGQKVVGYLENRGVGMDLIKSFKLGYAPDGRVALVNEAVKANFSQEAFITSGLIGSSDTTG
ncbi:DNA primase, partial [Candidatus Peregrinibacteria bacterium CG_4_9_14_0_2_um_filter_41_14]